MVSTECRLGFDKAGADLSTGFLKASDQYSNGLPIHIGVTLSS
jgi:hypothetical protein